MSAGPTIISRYECVATGQIHPIRIQPETAELVVDGDTNAPPAGAADTPVSAQVSQGKRSLGVNARTVTIRFPDTAPTGYKVGSPIRLPWLTPFPTPAYAKGSTVTYLGSTGELVGTSEEKVN